MHNGTWKEIHAYFWLGQLHCSNLLFVLSHWLWVTKRFLQDCASFFSFRSWCPKNWKKCSSSEWGKLWKVKKYSAKVFFFNVQKVELPSLSQRHARCDNDSPAFGEVCQLFLLFHFVFSSELCPQVKCLLIVLAGLCPRAMNTQLFPTEKLQNLAGSIWDS